MQQVNPAKAKSWPAKQEIYQAQSNTTRKATDFPTIRQHQNLLQINSLTGKNKKTSTFQPSERS